MVSTTTAIKTGKAPEEFSGYNNSLSIPSYIFQLHNFSSEILFVCYSK